MTVSRVKKRFLEK